MAALKVLIDVRERHWNQNPYISMLAGAMPSGVEVKGFSWTRALLGRYGVVHLHWPEYLVSGRGLKRLAAVLLALLWSVRLRLSHTPVIRTKHNLRPHDGLSRARRIVLRSLPASSQRILLTQSEGSSEPGILIPHANYLPWLKGLTQSVPSLERTDGYLVFGVLKPYKGIERAVDAALRSRGAELLIAGESKDNNYLASLERKASASSAVTIHAMRLNDADLVRRIQSSAAVVVPYPELYNSGVVLLALSLNRPVVVQRSTVAEALEIEFGSDWIRLIDFEVDELPRVPALSQVHWNQERTWRYSGRAHARIYRAVAKRATS